MVTISQRVRVIVLSVILCFVCTLAIVLIVQNVKLSQVTYNKITRKCPYDIPENYQWTMYTGDNILGLVASMCVGDSTNTSMILVFDFSKSTEGTEDVVEKSENFIAGFGSQESQNEYLVNSEVVQKGDYTYVEVTYSNSAVLSDISFIRGADSLQREVELEINSGEVAKLKYFADKTGGVEGYYLGQAYISNASAWAEPGYYEVVKDVL